MLGKALPPIPKSPARKISSAILHLHALRRRPDGGSLLDRRGLFTFALDTGMVARTLFVGRLTLSLGLLLGWDRTATCLDIGGGTGLLTRYLRDHGLDAHWSDKYATNIFARGFDQEIQTPSLMTAFEVFEHLTHPRDDILALLEKKPEVLLFSTKLYTGQGSDWWYFLEDGQHVQFYSAKGLALIADEAGYHFQTEGTSYHLFSRRPLPAQSLKKALRGIDSAEKRALKLWGSRTESDHSAVKRGNTSRPIAQPTPPQNALR